MIGRPFDADAADDWQLVWHHLHDALGSKWATHVLRLLADGPAGFNEMRRALDGVTAKTLSERLRELRCHGLVEREVLATSPPRTRYSLTPAGEGFVALLRSLEEMVEVVDCRACAEDACDVGCEVLTVDAARTSEAMEETC